MIQIPVITALDDWKRICIFDAAASFSEFQPDPPASIPTISARSIENPAGLTLGTPSPAGGTAISLFVSGGSAGNSYDLKCKITLASGLKLSIPAIYTVVAPGDGGIEPIQFDHLIDPIDDTTWTRDYVFAFGDFDEFNQTTPPTISIANFVGVSGVTAIAQLISGTDVIMRIFCSVAGTYAVRCQVTLSDGTQLSVPGNINAVLGAW
jgi:hypothetical protein